MRDKNCVNTVKPYRIKCFNLQPNIIRCFTDIFASTVRSTKSIYMSLKLSVPHKISWYTLIHWICIARKKTAAFFQRNRQKNIFFFALDTLDNLVEVCKIYTRSSKLYFFCLQFLQHIFLNVVISFLLPAEYGNSLKALL